MSFLVWELDHGRLRQTCIVAAYYRCGWHREDTLEEVINEMYKQGGTPDDTACFESFCGRMKTIECGQHLIEAANDNLLSIYSGQLSHEPISIGEILMTTHYVEDWFEELAE